MAVTVHPHRMATLHGPARIASLGAALTAAALLGVVGVDALTDDGDPTAPVVRADPGPADPSFLGGPAATDTGGRSSAVEGTPEQRALLDQMAVDMGLPAGPASPDRTAPAPAMPFDPGVVQGPSALSPAGDD